VYKGGWRKYPLDIGEICESILGGLVGITSPAALIQTWEAIIIGFIAGWVTLGGVHLTAKLGVDDPVGAMAVHYWAGIWSVLCTAFFANPGSWAPEPGIFYGGSGKMLGSNILMMIIITLWAGGMTFIFLLICKHIPFLGLRIDDEDEELGADLAEHDLQPQWMLDAAEHAEKRENELRKRRPDDMGMDVMQNVHVVDPNTV